MSTAAPVESLGLLDGPPGGSAEQLASHLGRLGPLPAPGAGTITMLETAGTRGRGGAGFLAGRKWAAVAERSGGRAVVIANGVEGEPGSLKDRWLLAYRPHLVLDGLVLAAGVVGAGEVIICVREDDTPGREALRRALGERTDLPAPPQVRPVPDHYILGEETALIAWLDGGPPKPTLVPPRPFERGLHRRPTLVNNVETLAQAAIAVRQVKRTGSAGTSALVTLRGAVAAEAVGEVVRGTTVGALVEAAGGTTAAAQAVLIGGYFGRWLDPHRAWGLELDVDVPLGAGVIGVLPDTACGVAETARITAWLAAQSAHQCGPCWHGLPALAEGWRELASGAVRPAHVERLGRWAREVRRRGACRHPDGTAAFVESALEVFADEVRRHIGGRCSRRGSGGVLPVPGGRR